MPRFEIQPSSVSKNPFSTVLPETFAVNGSISTMFLDFIFGSEKTCESGTDTIWVFLFLN